MSLRQHSIQKSKLYTKNEHPRKNTLYCGRYSSERNCYGLFIFFGGREQGGQDNLNNAHLVEIKKVAKNQQICSWYMERRKNIGGMRNVSLNNKKAFKFRATLLTNTNVVL